MPTHSHSLPPDLEELHRELDALHIEERPSFGPELERELETELHAIVQRPNRAGGFRRAALAASVGGVLALGTVPGVRGAIVRAFEAVMTTGAPVVAELPTPSVVSVAVSEMEEPQAPRVFVPLEQAEQPVEAPAAWANETIETLAPEYAYPVLRDPADAERIVEMFYPDRLQTEGIGGSVRVMVWVDENGFATDREVLEGSGVDALDRAARSALGRLRFHPARRGGSPVGSWVKFTIEFQPPEEIGAAGPLSIREGESLVVDAGPNGGPLSATRTAETPDSSNRR